MRRDVLISCIQDFNLIVPGKLVLLNEDLTDAELKNCVEILSLSLFDPALTHSVVKSCRPILIELASRILDSPMMHAKPVVSIENIVSSVSILLPLAPQLLDSVVNYFTLNRSFMDRIQVLGKKNDSESTGTLKMLLASLYGELPFNLDHIILSNHNTLKFLL
jgi:hypothetical protein